MKHNVKSFDELHKTRPEITDANKDHEESLSKLDKVAVWITDRVGTMGFFIAIFILVELEFISTGSNEI